MHRMPGTLSARNDTLRSRVVISRVTDLSPTAGLAAPMLFVSANQVNALIPFEATIPANNVVPVMVTSSGGSITYNIRLTRDAPAIFTRNGAGTRDLTHRGPPRRNAVERRRIPRPLPRARRGDRRESRASWSGASRRGWRARFRPYDATVADPGGVPGFRTRPAPGATRRRARGTARRCSLPPPPRSPRRTARTPAYYVHFRAKGLLFAVVRQS